MIGRFPLQKLAKYPHMQPEDIAVWERFLINKPEYFKRVDYDVPVGKGAPQNPDHPKNIQADGKILTQKKIDVVGYFANSVTVVEIGPIADMRKLGQILTYHKLYAADHPEHSKVLKMVLCGEVERELEDLFIENGVILEVA